MECRHSPRIQARLQMEAEKKQQQQRDVRLNNRRISERAQRAAMAETARQELLEKRRISEKAQRAAMAETARQELLEKRRNTHHMRTLARAQANKDECEASTSSANEQLPVGTAVVIPDNSGKESINSQEKSLEKRRLEMRRAADKLRRSSMSAIEKDKILEKRRLDYEMRVRRSPRISEQVHRLNVDLEKEIDHHQGTGTSCSNIYQGKAVEFIPRRSPRLLDQVQRQDEQVMEHSTEASRKRKGKLVTQDNQKRSRTNSYVPDRNTLESLVTRCNVAEQVITRQSPRLLEQVQLQDELTAEESRKRKGKAVAVYQERRRANSYIPVGNTSKGIVIGSTDGEKNNNDPMDYDTDNEGEHYEEHHEIDTSDDDDGADDDNRISRPVRLHDNEAGASTSCSVPEQSAVRRSPRLLLQTQRPRYSRVSNRRKKGVRHFLGKMDVVCIHCGAMHFMDEKLTKSTLTEPTFGTCCLEGRIILPNLREPPEEFKELLEGTDEVAKHYRENIRRYNTSNAFTSLGCTLKPRKLKGAGIFDSLHLSMDELSIAEQMHGV